MTATTNTADFAAMGKEALRQAMRDAGLSYAKLNNDGMRAALVAHRAAATEAEAEVEVAVAGAWWATSAAATEAEAEVEVAASPSAALAVNVFASMFAPAPAAPAVQQTGTMYVDGKKVDPAAPATKEERKPRARIEKAPAPVVPRPSLKGMKVQKEREVRNGVKRHSEGTVCDNIWLAFDANPAIKAGELQALADANGWNRTNVACEFYAWRKFNGISGRAAK
jgi:hypothetical protein